MANFVLGAIFGFVFAVLCVSRLVVGKISRVQDEDGVYPFMTLNEPGIENVFRKKYIVLEVSNSQE